MLPPTWNRSSGQKHSTFDISKIYLLFFLHHYCLYQGSHSFFLRLLKSLFCLIMLPTALAHSDSSSILKWFFSPKYKFHHVTLYFFFPDSSVGKESACNAGERPWFNSWLREICWRRDRLPTPVFLGFPCGSAGKESTCNVGDLGLIPGLRRSPGEGKGYPLQYSGLENSMDCIVHGVTKSWTRLSNFYFHFHVTLYWKAFDDFHCRGIKFQLYWLSISTDSLLNIHSACILSL